MKLRIHESLANQPGNVPIKFSNLSYQALFQQRVECHGNVTHRTEIEDHLLREIHLIAPLLKTSSEPLFYLNPLRDGMVRVCATALGTQLAQIAFGDWRKVHKDFPVHVFSPYIRCFLKIIAKLPSGQRGRQEIFSCLHFPKRAYLIEKIANRLVCKLRECLRCPRTKIAQESFGRSANENFKGLVWIYEWIAQEHMEVVNLRFDTHMREEGARPYKSGDKPRIKHLNHFLACRARFHRWLTARFGDDLLIYAWTLEYGHESAFHHHYLVTLKPHGNNKDHVALVEEIGRKWEAITKDLGWIHNCNERQHSYPYRALGLVRLDNPEVIKGLHFIAAYLTLGPVYVKLDLPRQVDAFDKGGHYPKVAPIPQIGRPLKRLPVPIAITAAEGRDRYVNFL